MIIFEKIKYISGEFDLRKDDCRKHGIFSFIYTFFFCIFIYLLIHLKGKKQGCSVERNLIDVNKIKTLKILSYLDFFFVFLTYACEFGPAMLKAAD